MDGSRPGYESLGDVLRRAARTLKGNKINGQAGFGVEGIVEMQLERRLKDGSVYTRRIKNTITPAGKQMLLAQSAARMLNASADFYGKMAVLSALGMEMLSSSGYGIRSGYNKRDITNLLLNISDTSGITAATNIIPVLSAAGEKTDAAAVVGYANNDASPVADGKAGHQSFIAPEYLTDGVIVGESWVYPEGVATGSINCVAMAPYAVYGSGIQGLGIRTAKCLDKVNLAAAGSLQSSRFCPPGIPGITSDDEVLCDYTDGMGTQHKINLATGAVTDIDSGWPGLPRPQNSNAVYAISDYYYDGSRYLYLLDSGTSDGSTYVWTCSVYDTQGGVFTYVTSFNVNVNSSLNQTYGAYFIGFGGKIYISFLTITSSGTQNQYGLYALSGLTGSSSGYYSSYTNTRLDYATVLGFVTPSALTAKDFALKSLSDGRWALIVRGLAQTTGAEDTDMYAGSSCNRALIFTDLANPLDSAVSCLEWLPRKACIISSPTRTGVLSVGLLNTATAQVRSTDAAGGAVNTRNATLTSTSAIQGGAGVWYSAEDWSANLLSYVLLPEPIVKGDTDVLTVSYYYKII